MSRQFLSTDTDKWLYGYGIGSDGDLTISSPTTDSPIDASCSGSSGTTNLSATNASFAAGQLILVYQSRGTGAGAWELNKIAAYSAGTITTYHNLQNTYTDSGASQAQVLVIKQYNTITINSALTAKAWNGNVGGIIVLMGRIKVTGSGSISLTGKGYLGASTHPETSGDHNGYQGEGTGGARDTESSSAANGNGGSGGREPGNNGGSGGGHANAGTKGTANPDSIGIGGEAVGNASLTSIFFGGAGGSGCGGNNDGTGGSGGNGGGILFVFSPDIDFSSFSAVGINGGSGGSSSVLAGGGGAGAGGAGLLKGSTINVGTGILTATAGSVAGGHSRPGGSGSVGRLHADYVSSISGTSSPSIDTNQDTTLIQPFVQGGMI